MRLSNKIGVDEAFSGTKALTILEESDLNAITASADTNVTEKTLRRLHDHLEQRVCVTATRFTSVRTEEGKGRVVQMRTSNFPMPMEGMVFYIYRRQRSCATSHLRSKCTIPEC